MHRDRPHFGEPEPSDKYDPTKVYADVYSNFVPSESIFGWSWLGGWAQNGSDAPPEVAAWLNGWVDLFNEAAEAELSGDDVGVRTDIVVQNFLTDLYKQTWWSGDPSDPEDTGVTGQWIAVQKLRYGITAAPGEYDALVQTYRDHVADVLRSLGFVDANGNLTKDIDSPEITELIEGVDGLLYRAGAVAGGLPTLNENALNDLYRITEKHFLSPRTFDTAEGIPEIGAGQLQDTYNWIKSLGTNNYISLTDEEIWDMVFRLKREEISFQGVWDRVAGQVGDQYDFLEGTNIMNRINQFAITDEAGWGGGSNLRTHLEPIRTAIANTWGMTKNEVNLGDVFGPDLGGLDGGRGLIIDDENAPNGERFMNSREARRWAREQPQFLQTDEYSNTMQSMVQSILNLFGAR